MGGDDELPGLVRGVDNAREQVGEGFADTRAGFEKQMLVVHQGGGDGAGHLRLLGPVLKI